MNLIFNKNSFDTVITPWFLDVIPQTIVEYLKRINAVLKKEGHWIYFGPSSFHKNSIEQQYSGKEIKAIALAQGFEVVKEFYTEVPYLQSPNSGQQRFENVLYLSCRKGKKILKSLRLI